MSDNIDQAFDTFSEQNKKYDLAIFYTRGDKEKAKDMVSGIYKDLYAVKTTFSASTNFGAYLMFFSIPYCTLIGSYVIVSSSYEIDEIKSSLKWTEFEREIDKQLKKGKSDYELGRKLKDALNLSFTIQMTADQRSVDLRRLIEANDQIAINRLMSNFIQDKLGYQLITINVDYENISSLDMEMYSMSSRKVTQDDIKKVKDEIREREKPKIEIKTEEEDELKGKDVKLILEGEVILAPIKGKDISTLDVGDRIKINLDSYNPKAVSVARAFKCYNEEEGRLLPVPARIMAKDRLPEGGFKILALIAKGIYVKIIELEEGIKVAMDLTGELNGGADEEESPGGKIQMILIYVIAVLIIVGLAIIFFK